MAALKDRAWRPEHAGDLHHRPRHRHAAGQVRRLRAGRPGGFPAAAAQPQGLARRNGPPEMISNIDYLPTILDLAGLPDPEERAGPLVRPAPGRQDVPASHGNLHRADLPRLLRSPPGDPHRDAQADRELHHGPGLHGPVAVLASAVRRRRRRRTTPWPIIRTSSCSTWPKIPGSRTTSPPSRNTPRSAANCWGGSATPDRHERPDPPGRRHLAATPPCCGTLGRKRAPMKPYHAGAVHPAVSSFWPQAEGWGCLPSAASRA